MVVQFVARWTLDLEVVRLSAFESPPPHPQVGWGRGVLYIKVTEELVVPLRD